VNSFLQSGNIQRDTTQIVESKQSQVSQSIRIYVNSITRLDEYNLVYKRLLKLIELFTI